MKMERRGLKTSIENQIHLMLNNQSIEDVERIVGNEGLSANDSKGTPLNQIESTIEQMIKDTE
jgi:hypothetical protein